MIDLVAVGSGGSYSVPPARLKQLVIEKVPKPENWPFDTMLTRTRAQAMKRMMDRPSLTVHAKRHARCKL
jgi:hypothetical protein